MLRRSSNPGILSWIQFLVFTSDHSYCLIETVPKNKASTDRLQLMQQLLIGTTFPQASRRTMVVPPPPSEDDGTITPSSEASRETLTGVEDLTAQSGQFQGSLIVCVKEVATCRFELISLWWSDTLLTIESTPTFAVLVPLCPLPSSPSLPFPSPSFPPPPSLR